MDEKTKDILCKDVISTSTFEIGTVFYRGGECKNIDQLIRPRSTNVFLSTTGTIAKSYSNFWQIFPYGYVYRAINNKKICLLNVGDQMSRCRLLKDHLGYEKCANIFQRDDLLTHYREIYKNIDGLLYEDEENSEYLIDNNLGLLDVEDYAIFPREKPNLEIINRILGITE